MYGFIIGEEMPQSLSRVILHIVFSTKNREPFINQELKEQFYSYISSIMMLLQKVALVIKFCNTLVITL